MKPSRCCLTCLAFYLSSLSLPAALPPKPAYTPSSQPDIHADNGNVADFISQEELVNLFMSPDSDQWKAVRRQRFPQELSHLPDPPQQLAVIRSEKVSPTQNQRRHSDEAIAKARSLKQSAIPHHYVVQWVDSVFPFSLKKTPQTPAERVKADGTTLNRASREIVDAVGGDIYYTWNLALPGFAAVLTPEQADLLRKHPDIATVEPDYIVEMDNAQTTTDPGLYGLDRIDEHNISSEDVYRYARTGAGVHAYVVDSGIRTSHEEFNNPNRIGEGWSGDGGSFEDTYGHGTRVASVLGGNTFGVAKGVTLHPVKTGSKSSDYIDAFNWIRLHHEESIPAVVNISAGFLPNYLEDPAGFKAAILSLIDDGIVVVTSAGNGNTDASNQFPAGYEEVITVGAVDCSDGRAIFFDSPPTIAASNYGPIIEIWAPGKDILTANANSDSATRISSGTSYSAPMVAGAAARYLEANPSASHLEVRNYLVNTATTGKISGDLHGAANRLLFINGWFYPFHTFAEWVNSDVPVSSNYWFYREELGGWIWTSESYYLTGGGWFYRDIDDTWLELWATDPWLTFYNSTTGNLEIYEEL